MFLYHYQNRQQHPLLGTKVLEIPASVSVSDSSKEDVKT